MSALVLWNSLWRGQYEITVNLLEEMWSRNLVNLFSSPLRIGEWIVAVILLGFTKLIITECFAILAIYFLYATNVLSFGWYLLPFFAALLLTGWAAGFFVAALIIGFGTKIQTLAWSGAFLLAPFSGVYYPISTLPEWAQKVASVIPSSYIFEGMRQVLFKNTLSHELLVKSFLLNGFYLTLALAFFLFMFKRSKAKGLSRLE
jgi:ABC-2 type transport system permease protein